MTGSINVGPRVMMSRESLASTGLLVPGSRAAERFLFRLPVENAYLQPVRERLHIPSAKDLLPIIPKRIRSSSKACGNRQPSYPWSAW